MILIFGGDYMQKLVKELALTTAPMGVGVVGLNQQPLTAQAAVKTHKVKSMPKKFRGTWYQTVKGKTYKLKVSAKRFGISKYRHAQVPDGDVAGSERYFTPLKVTHAKPNTLYLINFSGAQALRQTTIKHHKVLIEYDQQEHGYQLNTWTRAKKSSAQKSWATASPGGLMYSVKVMKKNRNSYAKVNPYIKKYFGKAVKKKVLRGFGKMKHVKITYYNIIKYDSYIR